MKRFIIFLVCIGFVIPAFAENILDVGFYLRLRQEYFDNAFDFDNESVIFKDDNYFRVKTGVWGRWNLSDNVNLYIKLMSEPKIALYEDGKIAAERDIWDDEIYFDNLYLDVKNFLGIPVDLRVGRQDFLMTHGEGFVIMDGTPSDGSRSFYFNALKATMKLNEKDFIDLIYLTNPATDEYLPVINNQDRQVVRTDEEGFIVYGRFKPDENISLEPYYIHKFEEGPGSSARNLRLNTVGNRTVLDFAPWRLRSELAYQFGEYKDKSDREAWGGYLYLTKSFDGVKLFPSLDVGYAYLSGEGNPTSGNDYGWNPLFAKWPWISELYLFGYAIERGEPGYWTNLQLWRAKLDMKISEKTGLSLAYNYLKANEPQITGAPFFGTGRERGHLAHAILTQRFNQNVSGHLHLEFFKPGDFYASENRDNAIFLRWQIEMKI